MRAYTLSIDNKPLFFLNEKNPNAPRLTFNFTQTDSTDIPNSIITIDNPSISLLGNLDNLIGKKIELRASVKEDALTKKYGITPIQNDLIGTGFISGAVANSYSSTTNSQVMFVIRGAAKIDEILFEVKKGDGVKSKIKNALELLFPNSQIIIPSPQDSQISQGEILKINSLGSLQLFAFKYKVKIVRSASGFAIMGEKESSQIPPKILKPQDFLTKPTQIRTSTLSMFLHLRGDLSLGQKVEIPTSMFATVPPQTKFILAKPKAYVQGVYTIQTIRHIGDSRGKGGVTWATNIEAVKI